MLLKLPPSLHYPITVKNLLKQLNEDVERFGGLLSYSYTTTVEVVDRDGNVENVQESMYARFESSVEGTVRKWFVKKGDVIKQPG